MSEDRFSGIEDLLKPAETLDLETSSLSLGFILAFSPIRKANPTVWKRFYESTRVWVCCEISCVSIAQVFYSVFPAWIHHGQ